MYLEIPCAINAIPIIIVINIGLFAANIAMNITTIPKIKVIKVRMKLHWFQR